MKTFENKNLIEIFVDFFKQKKFNYDLSMGVLFLFFHFLYAFLVFYNAFFKNNLISLLLTFFVVLLNIIFVIYFRTCPVSLVEEQYLNTNFFRAFGLLFGINKKRSPIKKITKTKCLSFYLGNISFQENVLQNLGLLNLFLCIKILLYSALY